MKFEKIILICIWVILLFSCSRSPYRLFQEKSYTSNDFFTLKDDKICPQPIKHNKKKSKKIPKKIIYEYKIAPRDRLKITVFNHPELSTLGEKSTNNTKAPIGIIVSQRGTISLPLIGEVKVAGLTQEQAANLLTNKFKKYLKRPYVAVEVLNKRVYVIGEVKSPGVIPVFTDTISLIEALAQSGGMTEYAERNQIMILRGDLHDPDIIKINLTNLESIKVSDLMLKPNDIVYVPPNKVRARNLGIKSVMPVVNLIGKILSSFANIKYLSE